MSWGQFSSALRRHGMVIGGLLGGYVDVGGGLHVFRHNAGPRLRDQLAYLLQAREDHDQQKADALKLSDALALEFGLAETPPRQRP